MSITSHAATCEDKLSRCDSALKAADKVIQDQSQEIDLANMGVLERNEEIGRLEKENADLRDSQSAFFKNPYVLILLGVVGGALLTK